MTKHTETCLANQAKVEADRAVYALQWPNYCRVCDGWGIQMFSYDPSPSGVSLGSGCFWEVEPCFDCYENSVCPRCGNDLFPDQSLEDTPCLHCGFKEGDEGMPRHTECDCWTMELDRDAQRERLYDLYGV